MQTINVGTNPNDGTGDSLRNAFIKVQNNFNELVVIDSSFSGDIQTLNTIISNGSTLNHTHTISQIIGLQTALSGKVSTSTFNTQILAINSSIQTINSTLSTIIDILNTKIGDAPYSGITYGRNNGSWVEITGGTGTSQNLQQVTNNGATTTNTITVNSPSGQNSFIADIDDNSNGFVVNTTQTSYGLPFRIFNEDISETPYSVDVNGTVNANSFVKINGLATEYLMANGSVTTGSTGTIGPPGPAGPAGANGISQGQIYYFNNSISQTPSPYKQIEKLPTSTTQSSILKSTNGQTPVLVQEFITDTLDTIIIPPGSQRFHLHFLKQAQGNNTNCYATIQLANSGGTPFGNVLTTNQSEIGWFNNVLPVEVYLDVVIPASFFIDVTDRMIVKLYVIDQGSASHNVTWFTEGTTNYSYVITSLGVSSGGETFTGGTVTGPTIFTNGLSANTFSATTIEGGDLDFITLSIFRTLYNY